MKLTLIYQIAKLQHFSRKKGLSLAEEQLQNTETKWGLKSHIKDENALFNATL